MAFEGPVTIANLVDTFPLYANDGGRSHRHHFYKRTIPPVLPQRCVVVEETEEEGSGKDRKYTLRWKVPWSARIRFKQWVLGYSWLTSGEALPLGKSRIRRVIPDQHYADPECYALRLRRAGAGGVAVASETTYGLSSSYPKAPRYLSKVANPDGTRPFTNNEGDAAVTQGLAYVDNQGDAHLDGDVYYDVEYMPPLYNVMTDDELDFVNGPGGGPNLGELRRFTKWKIDYSIKTVSIQRLYGQQLVIVNTGLFGAIFGQPIQEGGLLFLPGAHVTATLCGMPDIPAQAIARLLNRVNAEPIGVDLAKKVGMRGMPFFEAETLMMQSPRIEESNSPNQRPNHDIEFHFDWAPQSVAVDKGTFLAGGWNVDALGLVYGWNLFPTANGIFAPATIGGGVGGQKVFQPQPFTPSTGALGTLFDGNPWLQPLADYQAS